MKKIHIDEINLHKDKNLLTPGPGNYDSPRTFGKVGQKKSLGSKLLYYSIDLKRSANLPGPGQYKVLDQLKPELGELMKQHDQYCYSQLSRK